MAEPQIPYSKTNDKAQDEKLLEPFQYILQVPGKNIRLQLTKAFNYWLEVPEDKLVKISDIIQILHNASLLLDDIQDNSILRRGIPVAHSIYGIASTINASNYVTLLALEKSKDLEHPDAMSITLEQILELHRGQGMEIYWRDNYTCPREEEYIEMVKRKTGSLFMLAVKLMALFSPHQADYSKLANLIGVYFQIRDDYINLVSKDYMKHKTFCEDLTEGKFSFPIIHGIQSQPNDNRIIHILRQRTKEEEVKKYCVDLLEKFGSFDHTRHKLKELEQQIKEEVEKFGGNPHMEEFINSLAQTI